MPLRFSLLILAFRRRVSLPLLLAACLLRCLLILIFSCLPYAIISLITPLRHVIRRHATPRRHFDFAYFVAAAFAMPFFALMPRRFQRLQRCFAFD